MLELHYPDDFRGPEARAATRELYDRAAASEARTPYAWSFTVGAPSVSADRVTLPGTLLHEGETASALVAVMGLFSLEPASGAPLRRRPYEGPPRPPPVPPPPVQLELPPRSRVHVTSTLYLPDWIYEGTPTVTLAWTLTLWNEPRPEGTIEISLP